MEYYFKQPSTKYDWDDFRRKVFKKDNGKELQRRLIIKNIHSTTQVEFIELKHVILHMNALIQSNNVNEPCFSKLLEFFMQLKSYLYEFFIYKKIKENFNECKIFIYFNI